MRAMASSPAPIVCRHRTRVKAAALRAATNAQEEQGRRRAPFLHNERSRLFVGVRAGSPRLAGNGRMRQGRMRCSAWSMARPFASGIAEELDGNRYGEFFAGPPLCD